jgi:hypothetical protein
LAFPNVSEEILKLSLENIYKKIFMKIKLSELRQIVKAIIKEETDIPQEEIERFTCEDCGTYDYDMYMVNDDIWSKYGNESNTLCMNCLEKRMGRKLTKDDFSQYKNAPANKYNPQVKKLFNSGRFRFRF